MRTSYVISGLIAVLIVIWIGSGQVAEWNQPRTDEPTVAEQMGAISARAADEQAGLSVRARISSAVDFTRTITVNAETRPIRSVTLRAGVVGEVVSLPVEVGTRVREGQLICELERGDRPARVSQAEARVEQARLIYEGNERLKSQSFQSETALATARADLASARAELEAARVALADTTIRAPFDGVVEERLVELGDYLQPGGACATIVDADPMLVVGQVPEQSVRRLQSGQRGRAVLLDDTEVGGELRFVATTARNATRTFQVELRVDNPDMRLRGGMTAKLKLPTETLRVHRVPTSLLTLDDEGVVGLRIVDESDHVRFHPIELVGDAAPGVWVSGLPDRTRVITVGHELVVDGDRVEVDLEAGTGYPGLAELKPGTGAGVTALRDPAVNGG